MKTKYNHIVFLRHHSGTFMWGGLGKLMLEWFKRIDYSACRVTFGISPGGKEFYEKRFTENKIPVEVIEFPFNFITESYKNFNNMYRFLKALKPSSVIFIQGSFTDFCLATVLAGFLVTRNNVYMHENYGVPIQTKKLSKYHLGIIPGIGFWWYKQRFFNKLRSLLSRKIIVVGSEIKNQLIKLWGYPEYKVVLAYNGINLKEFHMPDERQQIRKLLNIPDEDFIFIISSRLSKEKRIERAIEAFDRLAKQRNNVWLVILGGGNLREELEQLTQQKVCKNCIIFLGHIDDVSKYLNAADAYVSSSDTEGLSISLLEAMASGIICLATNCSGSKEVIQNSQTGFLVEKSINGVFQGMEKALALNPKERNALSLRGIEFTNKHFEINRLVKNTLDEMRIPNIIIGAN